MDEEGGVANRHVRLTALIHCAQYKGTAPEYVLSRGRAVHQAVEEVLKHKHPLGIPELEMNIIRHNGVIHMRPDFVTQNGKGIIVYEVKASRNFATLVTGMTQLYAYMAALKLRYPDYAVEGYLVSVSAIDGGEYGRYHIKCPLEKAQKFMAWIDRRLAEYPTRRPIHPSQCRQCLLYNICRYRIYDEPPEMGLILSKLTGKKTLDQFL